MTWSTTAYKLKSLVCDSRLRCMQIRTRRPKGSSSSQCSSTYQITHRWMCCVLVTSEWLKENWITEVTCDSIKIDLNVFYIWRRCLRTWVSKRFRLHVDFVGDPCLVERKQSDLLTDELAVNSNALIRVRLKMSLTLCYFQRQESLERLSNADGSSHHTALYSVLNWLHIRLRSSQRSHHSCRQTYAADGTWSFFFWNSDEKLCCHLRLSQQEKSPVPNDIRKVIA